MKTKAYIVFLVLAFCTSGFAQGSSDAAVLTKLLNDFLAGAGKNDAAMHDRFWADDLIYTRSVGVRTNKEELMKGVRSPEPKKETDSTTVFTAEDVKIQQYGNTAVVAFRLVGTTTKPDGTKTVTNNLNTGTFVKRKGEWRAVAWQSTVVPLMQTAANPTVSLPAPVGSGNSSDTAVRTENAADRASPPADRKYIKGPRGGCYYMSPSGSKVYVDKKFCP